MKNVKIVNHGDAFKYGKNWYTFHCPHCNKEINIGFTAVAANEDVCRYCEGAFTWGQRNLKKCHSDLEYTW